MLEFKIPLIIIFLIGVLVDVFAFQTGSDIRLFSLILFWVFLIKMCRFKSDVTLKMTLVYLLLLFFLFLFARTQPFTDRVSTWIYLFLIIGVIQQFKEMRAS